MRKVLIVLILFVNTVNCNIDDKKEKLKELFELSNFSKDIMMMPSTYFSEIGPAIIEMGAEPYTEVYLKSVSDSLMLICYDIFDELSVEEIDQISLWYKSELGEKIAEVEAKTEFSEESANVDNEKVKSIKAFVKIAGVEELNNLVVDQMGRSFAEAIFLMVALQKGMTKEEIKEFMQTDDYKSKIDGIFIKSKEQGHFKSEFDINEYIVRYSSLTVTEIQNYTDFYYSESGAKFLNLQKRMLSECFGILTNSVIERVLPLFKEAIKDNQDSK